MKTPAVKSARMAAMKMKGFQLSKFAACTKPPIMMMIKTEGKECHLLKLLHDGLVHHEADDEADAHHQEEDGADGVHHQVDGEVPHLGDLTLD